MCRSIKTLHRAGQEPAPVEIDEAALQYVRKLSGYRKPSRKNEAAFEAAVREVSEATQRLLANLEPR